MNQWNQSRFQTTLSHGAATYTIRKQIHLSIMFVKLCTMMDEGFGGFDSFKLVLTAQNDVKVLFIFLFVLLTSFICNLLNVSKLNDRLLTATPPPTGRSFSASGNLEFKLISGNCLEWNIILVMVWIMLFRLCDRRPNLWSSAPHIQNVDQMSLLATPWLVLRLHSR